MISTFKSSVRRENLSNSQGKQLYSICQLLFLTIDVIIDGTWSPVVILKCRQGIYLDLCILVAPATNYTFQPFIRSPYSAETQENSCSQLVDCRFSLSMLTSVAFAAL